MSISVFEATTNINGFKEKLRREVATYTTDAMGVSADFSGLDKNFEKLVRKLGLKRKSLKVVKTSPLPQWAMSEGLRAAQLTNMYAAMVCEGALNPVITVCIPAARVVAMQCFGRLASADGLGLNQPIGWNKKVVSGQNCRSHCLQSQKKPLVLGLIILLYYTA